MPGPPSLELWRHRLKAPQEGAEFDKSMTHTSFSFQSLSVSLYCTPHLPSNLLVPSPYMAPFFLTLSPLLPPPPPHCAFALPVREGPFSVS